MTTIPMRRAAAAALALATAWTSSSAIAQDGVDALRTRSLAATCAACHGTEGRAAPGAVLPGLAGMPAPYLTEQMKAFKSGARAGTLMPQLAKGYSDAQIEQLAAWFAKVSTK